MRRAAGFTLLEILVALAIFAVVSVIAYSGLNQMLLAKSRVEAENRLWRELTQVLGRLDEDVSLVVNRRWRDQGGLMQPAVRGTPELALPYDCQLELVRKSTQGGGGLVHIGYRFRQQQLEMLLWDVLDQGPRTEPQIYPLMQEISGLDVQFLDARRNWVSKWPQATEPAALPKAVRVRLTLQKGGVVERLLVLP